MSDYTKYYGSRGKTTIKIVATSMPRLALGAAVFFRLMRRKEMTHYLICTPALGDAMIYLSYLAEFKRQRNINHVTVVCTEYTKRVCTYYSDVIDDVIYEKRWEYLALLRFYDSKIGQYYFGLNLDRITLCSQVRYANALWENTTIDYPMFVKAIQYKISLFSQPQRPNIPKADISKLVQKYALIPQKTVCLNPVAKTVNCDIISLLTSAAAELTAKGYKVITLTAKEKEPPVPGTKAVPCTLEEAFSLAEYGGTLIGLRSGFMDVMVYARCKIITVEDAGYGFNSFCSLERLGVNPDCHAVVYDGSNETALQKMLQLIDA